MPELAPFRGMRYAPGFDASRVTTPPYDVISQSEQQGLLEMHHRNFVRLILPPGGEGRYERAAAALAHWQSDGTLNLDPQEAYYLYRTDYFVDGAARSTAGLIGALTLERLGEGGVFPHEETLPGPKADRLNLMRSTAANLEPLWFVASSSLAGFQALVDEIAARPPLADLADPSAARHRLWRVNAARATPIVEALAATLLVIADGHHRYETALTYRDERREIQGPGPWDSVLAMVVDPAQFGPTLLPIHRIARGVDVAHLVARARASRFLGDVGALAAVVRSAGPGTIGIASREGLWTMTSGGSLDSDFLQELLAATDAEVTYEHELEPVLEAAQAGAVGFLMAPVALSLVIERAVSGSRMPPKTTLFWPKPRSGLVFRLL